MLQITGQHVQRNSVEDDGSMSMKQNDGYKGVRVGVGRVRPAGRLVRASERSAGKTLPSCGSHACFRFIQAVSDIMFKHAGAPGHAQGECIHHLQTRNASCSSRGVEVPRGDRTMTMRNRRYSP